MDCGGLTRDLLDQPAASITPEQLEEVWKSLADAAGRGAMRRERGCAPCTVGPSRSRKLENDPTKRAVLAEKPDKRQNFLTGEEARSGVGGGRDHRGAVRAVDQTFAGDRGSFARGGGARAGASSTPISANGRISGDRMKVGEPHVVWLPPIVREMLAGLPQFAGSDLVFTADGRRAATGFTSLKQQLDKALSEAPASRQFTFHDFRRSVTTWLVRTQGGRQHRRRSIAGAHRPGCGSARSPPLTTSTTSKPNAKPRLSVGSISWSAERRRRARECAAHAAGARSRDDDGDEWQAESSDDLFGRRAMKDQIEASEAQAEESFISSPSTDHEVDEA